MNALIVGGGRIRSVRHHVRRTSFWGVASSAVPTERRRHPAPACSAPRLPSGDGGALLLIPHHDVVMMVQRRHHSFRARRTQRTKQRQQRRLEAAVAAAVAAQTAVAAAVPPTATAVSSAPLVPVNNTKNTTTAVPASFRDMDATCLVTLGGMGNPDAQAELLKRHIMATDGVSHEKACQIFDAIEETNHAYMKSMAVPFQVGIVTACTAGLLSIPMVFHLPTVEYFNAHFVTAEHPPLKELETSLEVGAYVRYCTVVV